MSTTVGNLIKKEKPHLTKYKKYIIDNPWEELRWDATGKPKTDTSIRKGEFDLHNNIILTIINRLKIVIKNSEGDHHLKVFKDFAKNVKDLIQIHIDRADNYTLSISDLTKIESADLRSDEIAFHRHLHSSTASIMDIVDTLNIKDDSAETTGIEFLNNVKAPISMHNVLSEIYPEINRKLMILGIDLEKEPNNELHIYNPKPPIYNASKHYWEQEKHTLQYYFDEFKKLNKGIVVDDYYISPWMYYHMNVFVTPIPHSVFNKKSNRFESEDKIINPPLRDSDLIIFENHEKQKQKNILFMFIAATRRAAKTTLESSKLGHAATIGKKELLCAGGSTKDLNQIAKNFKIDIQYKNPAFSVQNISNDWKNKVELGLKTKSNKTILLSTLNIVNTDSGNNVEILAGFTPDEFLYDEAMKGKFLEPLQGLKPALKGAEGLIRCFGILSATGGDEALSADGLTVLADPEANNVLPMDWELLERGVPNEFKTWEEDKQKPFSTFIPGQMCVDMPKTESNIADYIGRPDAENLKKIKIKITDWEKATKSIQDSRDKLLGNKIAHSKEITYIPLKPSDITASGKESPFPIAEAKAHKEHLLRTGLWDRRRELYRDNKGQIQIDISTKELAPFPHKGGLIEAPFLIFEDPPKEKVKYGTYVGSFDDYATDDSETSSVSTFYVMKNKILGDPFSEKIVASLSIRPDKHPKVYEKWLMLMEAYQLEETCFGENFNYAIKDYLERKHLADKYLAPSLNFTQTFNLPNNLKRVTGWSPNTCKKILFNLFVDYCNEEFEVETEEGKIITLKGVQRIDDIWLLEEIIQYSENLNVDRITSAQANVGYIHFLNSSYRWRVPTKDYNKEKPTTEKRQVNKEKSFYSSKGRSFYRGK